MSGKNLSEKYNKVYFIKMQKIMWIGLGFILK